MKKIVFKKISLFLLSFLAAMLVTISLASVVYAQAPGAPAETDADAELAKDSSTEINVKNADIAAVVRIFSKKTKRNYILDENVKGKVTIYLPGKVSSDEAIRILDSVLSLKGFTSVPIGENLWKIVPSKDAKTSTIPTRMESGADVPSSAMVTRLVNLKYTNSEDMQQLVSQLVSPEGLINAYTGTNSLIIIDSEDNIERLVQIINSLDIPSNDRDMTIVPVMHADAVELATKLNEILGDPNAKAGAGGAGAMDLLNRNNQPPSLDPARANVPRPPGTPGLPSSVSAKTVSARAREPKIIPDERTNAIIIVADEDTTARMKALISQLDSEVDLSGNRFYVYRCQHANAEELAEVLSGLAGGSTGSTGTGDGRTFGSSFNRNQGGTGGLDGGGNGFTDSRGRNTGSLSRGNRFASTQDRLSGQQRTPGRSRSENGLGDAGPSTFNLGENISITADPSTNSLIISAGKTDYEKIKSLLKELDIKRRQVLVEAMILEVGVDNSTSLGTEFLASTGGSDGGVVAKSDFGNLTNLFSNPNSLSNFSVAAASSGTLTLPGDIKIPTQSILVSAAKSNANVNVLSAPNILTADNQQAEIVVGQNVPFLASQATSDQNLNNTFNQIDRQDVGITLRLTPQISQGDFVTMAIFTEVSNIIERTAGSPLGPTTTVRTSETTIIAKDGQMIVLGGLMSDDNVDAEDGVPFLSDVPVLGHLFRSTSERKRRTNLLIFITPRVVKDQFDARETTLAKRDRMEGAIEREEMMPNRGEILHSDDINNVAESGTAEEAKPGTILPPQKSSKKSRLETTNKLDADSEGAIELKVSPKLPEDSATRKEKIKSEPEVAAPAQAQTAAKKTDKPKTLVVVKDDTSALASMKQPAHLAQEDAPKIMVMSVENATLPANLPFHVDAGSKMFVVSVPSGSNSYSKGFFQQGELYLYKLDNTEISFKPVAAFSSVSDLKAYYPGLNEKLYTLSPYEIMNIGISPWQKGTR